MTEIGLDISKNQTNDVFEYFKQGRHYNFVITVCDESNARSVPPFPGNTIRLHWSFEDPSSFTGTYEEKLEKVCIVRDKIKEKILDFIVNYKSISFNIREKAIL